MKSMKEKIEELKKLSHTIKLLYVEDNLNLSNNMETLLNKIYGDVLIANDGEEGYKVFLEHSQKIVITDINMPIMNGFKMVKKMQAIEPECKVIILSAHDEKKHLYFGINLGVYRYLTKPVKIPVLVDALYDTITSIQKEENRRLFLNQLQSIFNYQNNIVAMMHEGRFILPNQRFLEFFGIDTLKDFEENYKIDELLLPHQEFLSSKRNTPWYKVAVAEPEKLFHTKIANHEGILKHLILKVRDVPEKDGHSILSFDDVTELNLMALFDSESTKNYNQLQDKMAVLTFLQIVQNNASEVKIHNYYKGLTIVNPGVIVGITEDSFKLKTVNAQLKIVQLTKFTTITSDLFPQSVICKSIQEVDSENQLIKVNDMSFSPRTGADRKHTRLETTQNDKCSLFYRQVRFNADALIIDISEVSVKVEINALPAGMKVDDEINITINLNHQGQLTSIPATTKLYRIDENKRSYYLVLLYKLDANNEETLKAYIVSRQMELIREFKKLNLQ